MTILHSQGIIHGNIRDTSIRVVKNLYKCAVGDFTLSCMLDNMDAYDRYIAPEIEFRRESTIREATTQRSDVYALGVFLFEMYFLEEYDKTAQKYYSKSVPEKITDLIHRCLNENEMMRPTMKDLYEAFSEVHYQFGNQLYNEEKNVPRHLLMRQRHGMDNKIQQYYKLDRNRDLCIIFAGTQNTVKAIEKVKSLVQLSQQDNESLDLLCKVCVAGQGDIGDNCFALISKLKYTRY
jgi:serine/threonine protein kinase